MDVLSSDAFAGTKWTQDFLQLIVNHALEGEVDSLRERMIGAEMFGVPPRQLRHGQRFRCPRQGQRSTKEACAVLQRIEE